MNIGIVWLMMKNIQTYDEDDLKGIRMYCRGLLSMKQLALFTMKGADAKKLEYEAKSFCEIYNKTPYLGFSFDE
jgi:hypothetical protein